MAQLTYAPEVEAATRSAVKRTAEERGMQVTDGPVNLEAGTREPKRLRVPESSDVNAGSDLVAKEEDSSPATVRSREAVGKSGGGESIIPPPWFDAAVDPIIAPMMKNLEEMETRLADICTTLSRLDTRIQNMTIFDKNQRSYAALAAWPIIMPLKVKEGFCPVPISAMEPTQEQRRDDLEEILRAAAHRPGASLPPSFPAISNSHQGLEPYEIGYLCRFYNDNFNIVEGNDMHAQNQKLRWYIRTQLFRMRQSI